MNDKTMFQLSYGLYVLTAQENGRDNGCIINTAMQVTANPNRISITVNKTNDTHDMILRTNKFTISIISEDADFDLFKRFGFQSGRDVNKFEGFWDCKRGYNRVNYITKGTNGFISAWVEQTIDLGTHTMFIAAITDMEILSEVPSATYTYYHNNIKPKPQAAEQQSGGKTAWRCTVCGYVHESEELPEDFICPICKHPASDFEKIVK